MITSKIALVVAFLVPSVFLISNESVGNEKEEVPEFLLNLTNFALESRQNRPYYPTFNRVKYPPYYQNAPPGQYGVLQYPLRPGFGNYPPQRPFSSPYPPQPYPPQPYPPQRPSVMEVLYSIANNDKLRCVPRLLCEVTSDTVSSGRQNFGLPSLPIAFNLESVIGILSTIDAASGSPITSFAKAALLGYTSKGSSDSCTTAYPRCPKDPDRLVQYLNNYNGGFFRFFNGINPLMVPPTGFPQQQQRPEYPQYPINYPYNNLIPNDGAEQRIQNNPVQYVPSSNYVSDNAYGNADGVIFPSENVNAGFNLNRSPKTLTFPNDDGFGGFKYYQRPKELPFSINHYYSNELDLQRPPANHKASPMIFPDRTGTGDLRLDPEELNQNYNKESQYYYYPQNDNNNNAVRFNPDLSYDDGAFELRGGRGLLTFPV